MVYHEWLEQWLDSFVKPARKTSTYELYCRIVRTYVLPRLGKLNMGELDAPVLQQFYCELSEKYAPNTVLSVMSVVKNSVKRANVLGIAARRGHESIQTPKPREREVECFSRAEQKKLENYIISLGQTKLFGIRLCLFTGMRIGELLALEWKDIDLRRGTISISKTCRDSWECGKYQKLFDTPKSSSSNRTIPLPRKFLGDLRTFRRKSCGNFVISDKKGEGVSVRSYQKSFALLQQKLGIPHRGFHSLRHTFATRAIECGMDVKVLSEVMGHENPMLTLKRYAHVLVAHKTASMNKLGKLYTE